MNTKIKHRILSLLLASTLVSACSKKSDSPLSPQVPLPTPQVEAKPDEEVEGGISAGGGGTLPANPIAAYKVVEIVDSAKRNLRLFINYVRKYNLGALDLETHKYYFREKNLQTVLEQADIEMLMDKPCKNKNGKDVDASIHASRPNTICLSVHRIAPKLIEENATKEILALLIHELSHFLGASEKEAVELQQMATHQLRTISSKDVADMETTLWHASMPLEGIQRYQPVIKDAIKANDLTLLGKSVQSVYEELSKFDDYFKESDPFGFTDFVINDYTRLNSIKLRLAQMFIAAFDPHKSPAHKKYKEIYDSCFRGKDKVLASEIEQNCNMYYDEDSLYQDYTFKNWKDLPEMAEDLKEVFIFINDLGAHVRAISYNQPFPHFHLPSIPVVENPWLAFTGSYTVTDKKCSANTHNNWNPFSEFTSIEIAKAISNYPIENQTVATLSEHTSNS